MANLTLPRHPGLAANSRLRTVTADEAAATRRDWLILAVAGIVAACASAFLDLRLQRVPGHAILRVVFPMAVGLALVPRRGAGSVMGGSALVSAVALRLAGVRNDGLGLGSFASLIATGPALDWTLRRSNGGWRQHLGFALAGLGSNLFALVVRGGAKALGWEKVGSRPLGEWLMHASVTYVICGLVAGLVSSVILFYGRAPNSPSATEGQP